jgi:disulfide bond formation protein DsbB
MTDLFFGIGAIAVWLAIIGFTLIPDLNRWYKNKVSENNLIPVYLILAVSLAATIGSLWYSEIIGYEPCQLCWYQRIFMYPIVLIAYLGIAIKDPKSLIYAKTLAIVGFAISLYHVIEQRLPTSGLTCSSVGQSASCDTLWVNVFGLVTIPTMALTMFGAIIVISTIASTTTSKSS